MRLLSQDFKYDNNLRSSKEHTSIFPEGFHVGIEVELENHFVPHIRALESKLWSSHTDGSLRNRGQEYVSIPVDGTNICKAVNSFWDQMPDYSFSPRTSVHVHVNCRKLSYEQLSGLLVAYCVMEPLLFDFVGRGRQRNIFCIPVTETVYPDRWLYSLSKGNGSIFGSWEKYSAVNLSRFSELGTIEFRQMHGTNDKAKILLWLEIISCLYQYGVANPFINVLNQLDNLTPLEFSNKVFNSHVMETFSKKDCQKLITRGYERVTSAIVGANVAETLIKQLDVNSSNFSLYLKGIR